MVVRRARWRSWLQAVAGWRTGGSRHRHLTGCSRGVGIRLVRDHANAKVPLAELAARMASWITSLGCRALSVIALDQGLIEALRVQPIAS